MRKLFVVFILLCTISVSAQQVSIKTNLLYLATTTPNIGVEFKINESFSFNLEGGYNPFEWSDDKFYKHYLVVPELRYWTCYSFNRSFLGIHGITGKYNLDDSKIFDHRYEGTILGAGLTYGYHLYLSKHWGIEFLVGLGFASLKYDKYECGKCNDKIGRFNRNYFGPTRAGISLVYIL